MWPFGAEDRRAHRLFALALHQAPLVFGVDRGLRRCNEPRPDPDSGSALAAGSGQSAWASRRPNSSGPSSIRSARRPRHPSMSISSPILTITHRSASAPKRKCQSPPSTGVIRRGSRSAPSYAPGCYPSYPTSPGWPRLPATEWAVPASSARQSGSCGEVVAPSSGSPAQATPRRPIAVCGHAASGTVRPLQEPASTRRLAAVCDRSRAALPSLNAAPNRPARPTRDRGTTSSERDSR
jgi:hypothetical protein